MTLYLDTSLLVALLTNEDRSAEIQHWIAVRQAEVFAASHWVRAEFAAALSMKLQNRSLTPQEKAASLGEFERLRHDSFTWLDIAERHFISAAELAQRSTGLRAGDALHLAVAVDHGASVCTLDKGMAKAAAELEIPCHLV